MTYYVYERDGKRVAQCGSLKDATMLQDLGLHRQVVLAPIKIDPETVNTSATEVSVPELSGQKILDMAKEEPFNP